MVTLAQIVDEIPPTCEHCTPYTGMGIGYENAPGMFNGTGFKDDRGVYHDPWWHGRNCPTRHFVEGQKP